MKKSLAAIMITMAMIASVPMVTVHADAEPEENITETVVEEYSYTQVVTSGLTLNGSTATCQSSVLGNSSCTSIVATQKLQKKTLWWWSDVATWSKTTNGKTLSMTNYGTASSSGTYRVRVEATVYSGSNSENVYADSVEKTK